MIAATGGVISQFGEWQIHTFLSSGVFAAMQPLEIEYLIVGGGGGGGGDIGGGGGGGGVILGRI